MVDDRGASSFTEDGDHEGTSRGACSVFDCVLNLTLTVYAKVTKLMGYEPLTKYIVFGVVSLQLIVAIALRRTYILSPWFLFCAYVIGGTANHNLFLAIHEITHNLAFPGVWPNKALAVFANLPIGIPYCAMFKVYRFHLRNYPTMLMDLEVSH